MFSTQEIKLDGPKYPEKLKKLKDAPKVLYYKGVLPTPDENCIAIVGTRRYSPYGQQVALKISGELADAGLTVVSGLAPGIDTFSHKAVVEKGKRTIAVLGTGLDEKSIYPQTNLDLSKKILNQGGCLISEWPEGTSGSKFSFPRRNRIISGLCSTVLVIEAKEKSGSLITADYALKQNRKLLAIPGPIYSLNSAGPNSLIKNGAQIITCTADILETMGLKNINTTREKFEAETDEEKLIIEALENGPLIIDKIIEKTKLDASKTATILAIMEISSKIRNLGGNTYSLN